ncbi:hypothetical protein [Bacillus subtilis]|uniref:hypothetical protein n=1 Tax=Bacillus subtilis TaxID=1423 RepID=UPI0025C9A4C1|nr:hypothetical protein [Bacillus subtilis]WCS68086.1 hypothetical protein Goe26_01740 [Bacillus phage vB_BsuM-Goe26]GLI90444.1 hypothetical protein ANABIO4_37960 [Bacillus subtilis]
MFSPAFIEITNEVNDTTLVPVRSILYVEEYSDDLFLVHYNDENTPPLRIKRDVYKSMLMKLKEYQMLVDHNVEY